MGPRKYGNETPYGKRTPRIRQTFTPFWSFTRGGGTLSASVVEPL